MTEERVSATKTVAAPAETVFAVLADPNSHQAIDGTGWVRESPDGTPITGAGQVFRMGMYHDNHPDKNYEMANRVEVFDRPHAIAWQPGSGRGQMTAAGSDDADLEFGGWIWRYDIAEAGPSESSVTLSYDWSQVPSAQRQEIEFPPFEPSHLENSLEHLAAIAVERR